MAKKKIEAGTIVIRMSDDGSYKIVEQQAKKTGAAFNTVGLNAQSADRAMKGVSKQSSNATKNFSKMAQGIGGVLVPAYATLAAQLFAIDALFRFLKDAADFRVLGEGQAAFAATTGMAIKSLAKDLQIATDAQISFKEASQAAAIGLAAGLSPTQLRELGAAAKTVSIALGRDVTDSFNRLVRGVTKAEPELLDELGIVLRLEEASIKYAAALGLNKNQLTIFQKSQAVTTEVLGQVEEKFGAINEIMDPTSNAINKVGIAFDELLNKARPVIATISEFIAKGITESTEAATFAIVGFTASIVGSLLPAMQKADIGRITGGAQGKLFNVLETKPGSKAAQGRLARFQEGEYTQADLEQYRKALEAKKSSLLNHHNFVKGAEKKLLLDLKILQNQLVIDQSTGFKRIMLEWKSSLYQMQIEYGKFIGTIKALGTGLMTAITGLLRWLGYIGLAITAFTVLRDLVDKFNGKTINKFAEGISESTRSMDSLNQELDKMAQVRERGLLKGIDEQISQLGQAFQSADLVNRLQEYQVFANGSNLAPKEFEKFNNKLLEQLDTMSRLDPEMKVYADVLREGKQLTSEQIKEVSKLADKHITNMLAIKSYNQAQSALVKLTNSLIQALPKLKYQDITDQLKTQAQAMEQLAGEHRKYAAQLLLVRGELEYINALNKEAHLIAMAQLGVSLEVAENSFGTKRQREAKAYEKTMTAVLNLAKARNELEAATYELSKKQGDESAQLRVQQAKGNIEVLKQNYRIAKAQQSELFNFYTSMLDDITSKLGSSIGAALRGEANAFKNIREELTKTLTDSVGKAISERMMEDLLGGTMFDPNKITKDIYVDEGGALQKGMQTASSKIEQAIKSGADYHKAAILIAFRLKTQGEIAATELKKSGIKGDINELTTARSAYNNAKAAEAANNRRLLFLEDGLDQISEVIAKSGGYESIGADFSKVTGNVLTDGPYGPYTQPMTLQAIKDEIAKLESANENYRKTQEKNIGLATGANEKIEALNLEYDQLELNIQSLNTALQSLPGVSTGSGTTTGTTTGNGIKRIDPNSVTLAGTQTTADKFKEGVDTFTGVSTKFLGGASMLLGAAGKSEEAAKLMEIAAKIQMAAMIYQSANSFFGGMANGGGLMGGLKALFGVRQGGIANAPGYRSYSDGAVSTGPSSGYLAELHGTEAVVPLPNGRSIPVEMQGKSGGTNNISVNVNMANGETTMTSDRGGEMGLIIAAAVKEVIADEQRAGGLLSGT